MADRAMTLGEWQRYEQNPTLVTVAIEALATSRTAAQAGNTITAWSTHRAFEAQVAADFRKHGAVGSETDPIWLSDSMIMDYPVLLQNLDHVHDLDDRCAKNRWSWGGFEGCRAGQREPLPDWTKPDEVRAWLT